MKTSMHAAVALALLGFSSAHAVSAAPLFKPMQSQRLTRADATASPALAALAASPFTAAVQRVDAHPDAVHQDTLEMELFGTPVRAARDRVEALEDGTRIWYGQIGNGGVGAEHSRPHALDPENTVIVVRSGGSLTASVRHDGQLYTLSPTAHGHALVQIEEARMPPDHPAGTAAAALPVPLPQVVPFSVANRAGPTVIRVAVMATRTVRDVLGSDENVRNKVHLAVAESNQGYINSGIDLRLELGGLLYGAQGETNIGNDLTGFIRQGDGRFDGIHAFRDQVGGDIPVLVTADGAACGVASQGFVAVNHGCMVGYYTFAHEIGHVMGATHDIEAAPGNGYNHGYRHQPAQGDRWRTILAYDCAGGCRRLNYYSSPNRYYNGAPMGDWRADNTRTLKENKDRVAATR